MSVNRSILCLFLWSFLLHCGDIPLEPTSQNVNSIDAPNQRRPGMGAIPYEGGTTFRVWAPNAQKVAVTGSFNWWDNNSPVLLNENNGYWAADIPGVRLYDQYKYVITNRDSGNVFWKNDPYSKEMTNSAGDSVVMPQGFSWKIPDFHIPSWNEVIIYEMHIGTFHDSPGFGPGHFYSARDKLDYLKDLGINAIQVMPIAEFATDFSLGYNPSAPFSVEKIYGGHWAFKEFVEAAHSRGIAVIVDVVYNHFGPTDLDMWQFDGWNINGKGGIYFYNDWRAKTQWGETRPDYGRGEVRQYIRDNALHWLSYYNTDGLRVDSTSNIRTVDNGGGGDLPDGYSLLQWVNNEIDWQYPGKLIIAEDMQNISQITKETKDGGLGFDSQWDSFYVHTLRHNIIIEQDSERNMNSVRNAIYNRYNQDVFERVIFTESHDEVSNGKARVPEEIWPGNAGSWPAKKRSTLGAVVTLTSPGIPMLFQGQEMLENGYFNDQQPLDWSKLTSFSGIHQLYRDLIRLRRNWSNNTMGLQGQHTHVFHLDNDNKIIAYRRWNLGGPGDDVIIILNFANRIQDKYIIGFPAQGKWRVRFNSDWSGYSTDFSNHPSFDVDADSGDADGLPFHGNICIGPYSALILSQDR